MRFKANRSRGVQFHSTTTRQILEFSFVWVASVSLKICYQFGNEAEHNFQNTNEQFNRN